MRRRCLILRYNSRALQAPTPCVSNRSRLQQRLFRTAYDQQYRLFGPCHFSGGQDSATCLGWALNRFDRVFTVGFDYGQRHHVEMECRRNVLNAVRSDASLPASWAARLGEDTLLSLGLFNQIGETAMTSDMEIAFNEQGIPNTFVPGRNLVFLTAAAALAWRKGIRHLVMGVCETDFPAIPTAATTPSRPCRSPSTSAWTPVSSCIPP